MNGRLDEWVVGFVEGWLHGWKKAGMMDGQMNE